MKIIAKRGFSATLSLPKKSITITQFEPVDLDQFTQEQLDKSNIETLLENGWIEEYINQSLPEPVKSINIPKVKSVFKQGDKDTEVKVSITKQDNYRVKTDVTMPESLPDTLHDRVEADKERQAAEGQRLLNKVKKTSESDVDRVPQMKPLKEKDLVRSVRVNGKIVENFKLPKTASKDEIEETPEE